MSHICNSCDGMAIPISNPTHNSAFNYSTHIPFTDKLNVNIGTPIEISNPVSNNNINSTSPAIFNSGTDY